MAPRKRFRARRRSCCKAQLEPLDPRVLLSAAGGDFAVVSTTYQATPGAGVRFNATTTFGYTAPAGAAAVSNSPAFSVRFVLSTDATLGNGDDVTLTTLRFPAGVPGLNAAPDPSFALAQDVTPGRFVGEFGGPMVSPSVPYVSSGAVLVFPPTLAPGAYKLYTVLDARGEVSESNETNNVAVNDITVPAPPVSTTANIAASIRYPTTPIASGGATGVFEFPTFTLTNNGTATSPAFSVLGIELDGNGDVLAYGAPIDGITLDPGQTVELNGEGIPAPTDTQTPGSVLVDTTASYSARFAAVADPLNLLAEPEEDDSRAVGPAVQVAADATGTYAPGPVSFGAGSPTITDVAPPVIPTPAAPDLLATLSGFKPAAITPGAKARVTLAVTNTSNAIATGSVPVTLYLSRFSILADADPVVLRTSVRLTKLKSGKSRSFTLKFHLPADLPVAGNYHVTGVLGTIAALPGDDAQTSTAMSNAVFLSPFFTDLALLSTRTSFTGTKVRISNAGNTVFNGEIALNGFADSNQFSGTILRVTRHLKIKPGHVATLALKLPRAFPVHGTYSLNTILTAAADQNGANNSVLEERIAHP